MIGRRHNNAANKVAGLRPCSVRKTKRRAAWMKLVPVVPLSPPRIFIVVVVVALSLGFVLDVRALVPSLPLSSSEQTLAPAATRTPTAQPSVSLASMRHSELLLQLKAVQSELHATRDELRNQSAQLRATQAHVEAVENTLFEDGSDPSNAVLENLLNSPDGRRWCRACDWPGCRTSGLLANAAFLVARQANQTRPPSTPGKLRAVRVGARCDSELDAVALRSFPALARHVESNASSCSAAVSLADVPDKALDLVVFDGTAEEDSRPYLYAWLKNWAPKLRVGGLALGAGYRVDRPYVQHRQRGAQVTPHERAVKAAVDAFRLGDDNGLGQDSSVTIAGGGLWFFARTRSTLLG